MDKEYFPTTEEVDLMNNLIIELLKTTRKCVEEKEINNFIMMSSLARFTTHVLFTNCSEEQSKEGLRMYNMLLELSLGLIDKEDNNGTI